MPKKLDFILLDHSGSMNENRRWLNARSALNTYVKTLGRELIPTYVTVALFDSENPLNIIINERRPAAFRMLDGERPDGGTPLYDAIHSYVSHIKAATEVAAAEAPDLSLIIITDGEDNESFRTADETAELLASLRALGWTILFLGLDYNATDDAATLRLPAGTFASFRSGSIETTMREVAARRAKSITNNTPLLLTNLTGQM